MKKNKRLNLFGIIQAVVLMTLPNLSLSGDVFTNDIRSVEVKVERLSELGDALSRIYRLPVCTEETRWFARQDYSPQLLNGLEKRRATGIEISITDAPLQRTLDQFIKQDDAYSWQFDASNGVVNLYPVQNAVADWYVPAISVQTQSVERLLFLADPLGLRDQGISFDPDRGNWSWMERNSITINTQGASLRDVLNSICAQLGESMNWTISEVKGGVFWDGTGRPVKYSLRFRRYRTDLETTLTRPQGSDESLKVLGNAPTESGGKNRK